MWVFVDIFWEKLHFCLGFRSVALIYLLSQTALGLCDSWRLLPAFICEMLNIQRSVLSFSHLWHHRRNPSRRKAAFTFSLCDMSQPFWMMVSDWCLEIMSRVMRVWTVLAYSNIGPQYTKHNWWFSRFTVFMNVHQFFIFIALMKFWVVIHGVLWEIKPDLLKSM